MKEKQYIVRQNIFYLRLPQLMNLSFDLAHCFSFFRKSNVFLNASPDMITYSQKVIFRSLGIVFFFFLSTSIFAQPSIESLQNQVNDLQQTLSLWKAIFLGVVAGFGVASTFIVLYFNKTVEVKKKEKELEVEQRIQLMEQKLIEGINEKEAVINLVLGKTNEEQVLLKTKRIYLWGEANSTNIRKVLQLIGFNMKNLITDEEAKAGYDVLLINNEIGMMSPKIDQSAKGSRVERDFSTIRDVMLQHEEKKAVCLFYYNVNQAHLPLDNLDFDLKHRINFATNPSQIYGNLMNTLKYQDRLQRGLAE